MFCRFADLLAPVVTPEGDVACRSTLCNARYFCHPAELARRPAPVAHVLIVWALVSFGGGILFRPLLSGIQFGGTDLGFWFAQQGSIIVFIVLIFYYAFRMNALDRKHGADE
jgi:putative solute:sodium symporter small subunit